MAIKDLKTGQTFTLLHEAKALTATANGLSIDTKGAASVTITLNTGVFTGTTPTATWQLQDSDDNSAFTVVDTVGKGLVGTVIPVVTDSNDQAVYVTAYAGVSRYVRFALTAITGASASLICSVTAITGTIRHQ